MRLPHGPLLAALGLVRGPAGFHARRVLLQARELFWSPLLLRAPGGGAWSPCRLSGALMRGQDPLARLRPVLRLPPQLGNRAAPLLSGIRGQRHPSHGAVGAPP